MKNISELANQSNLSVINIGTSFGLKEGEAVVGFTSFQEAVDFAEKNNMKVATFKNGTWQVGITPGLSVDLNKRISFITHFGFLGYRDSDYKNGGGSVFKDNVLGEDGFGFRLDASTLQFGFVYNF